MANIVGRMDRVETIDTIMTCRTYSSIIVSNISNRIIADSVHVGFRGGAQRGGHHVGGSRLAAPVEGWYDCGKPETLLETNQHLLETTRGWISPGAKVESTVLGESVRIEEGVEVVGSTLGPNVTVEAGATIVNSTIRDCIIGPDTVIEGSVLNDSLIGGHARIRGFEGRLSVTDHSEVG